MNKIQLPAALISSTTFFSRSSNSPRYLVPATSAPMSRVTTLRFARFSGTSPEVTCCASASTIAVFPTPGGPIRTGLFFVRLLKICNTRAISLLRPITGSNLSARAELVKSIPS